jgi:chromosome segregation ATPase
LPTVPTEGGLFNWFKYSVTGENLNKLTENIQNRMIQQNIILVKAVKEISAIYDTFSALDKVYVQEFYSAIKTALRAIEEVRISNEKISDQQKDIGGTQQDIRQMVNQQKQIIQTLKRFKEKLEKLRHLHEIDTLYSESQGIRTKIGVLEKSVAYSEKAIEEYCEERIATSKAIDAIENRQEAFDASLTDQKSDLERFDSAQRKIEQLLKEARDTSGKICANLGQSVADMEKRVSEAAQEMKEHNSEYIEKYNTLKTAVGEYEQYVTDSYNTLGSEIAQIQNSADEQRQAIQNDLIALHNENNALKKSLLLVRIVSMASLAVSFLLFLLMITGVLR